MDHKNLDAWKKSMDLLLSVYEETKQFPREEIFCLTQQMRRSAISIPSNIADGCARKGDKETIQFLYIAIGSLSELETQLIIANNLKYCDARDMLDQAVSTRKTILGLIRYFRNKKINNHVIPDK